MSEKPRRGFEWQNMHMNNLILVGLFHYDSFIPFIQVAKTVDDGCDIYAAFRLALIVDLRFVHRISYLILLPHSCRGGAIITEQSDGRHPKVRRITTNRRARVLAPTASFGIGG